MRSSGHEPSSSEAEHTSASHTDEMESTKDDEATNSAVIRAAEVAHDGNTEIVKISNSPFAAGYGDFCFGRRGDGRSVWGRPTQAAPKDPTLGSNGVPIPEIDSFQRTGCFHFEKLPLEIRRKIFRLMLSSFYTKHYATQQWQIPVTIWHHNKFDLDYNLTYDEFQEKRKKEHEEWKTRCRMSSGSPPPPSRQPECVPPPPKTYDEKKKEFENMSAELLKKAEIYPGRSGRYKMIAESWIHVDSTQYSNTSTIDFVFLEWVRTLSHVSRGFRNELGEAFWDRSSLSITVYAKSEGCRYFEDLHNFLKDRKASCATFSFLRVRTEDDQNTWPCVEENEVENVKERFEFFANNLRLRILELHLTVNVGDLEDLVAAKGKFTTVTATQQLVVTEKFELSITFEYRGWNCEDYDNWDHEAYLDQFDSDIIEDYWPEIESGAGRKFYAYKDMLYEEYLPRIRDLMLPNTLREQPKSPSASQQASYIDSRLDE